MDDSARREFAGFAAARSGVLIRVAFLLTGDQHAAEDLLQTAFTKAAARRGSRVEITDRVAIARAAPRCRTPAASSPRPDGGSGK